MDGCEAWELVILTFYLLCFDSPALNLDTSSFDISFSLSKCTLQLGATFRVKHFHQHQNFWILSTLMRAKYMKRMERKKTSNAKSILALGF